MDVLSRFPANLYKEDYFCDFLFIFLHSYPPSEKGSTLKRKNLIPRE